MYRYGLLCIPGVSVRVAIVPFESSSPQLPSLFQSPRRRRRGRGRGARAPCTATAHRGDHLERRRRSDPKDLAEGQGIAGEKSIQRPAGCGRASDHLCTMMTMMSRRMRAIEQEVSLANDSLRGGEKCFKKQKVKKRLKREHTKEPRSKVSEEGLLVPRQRLHQE